MKLSNLIGHLCVINQNAGDLDVTFSVVTDIDLVTDQEISITVDFYKALLSAPNAKEIKITFIDSRYAQK